MLQSCYGADATSDDNSEAGLGITEGADILWGVHQMEQIKSGIRDGTLRKESESLHPGGLAVPLPVEAKSGDGPLAGAVGTGGAGLADDVEAGAERFDPRSIEDDLWQMLKDWWGPEASVRELGLIEQRAKQIKQSPLIVLRQAIRYIVVQGLWG